MTSVMLPIVPELYDAVILVIEADSDSQSLVIKSLEEFENVNVFTRGENAFEFCRAHMPDLVILNTNLPSLDGWQVCEQLREMTQLTRCPVIFLDEGDDTDAEIKSWQAGASDFLRKPVVPAALKMRVMAHLTSHWHIEISHRLYHTDSLTGLQNRYFFDKNIKEQQAYAKRYNSDLSLLLIDIDQFNAFNQHHGHAAGDNALRKISQRIRQNVSRLPDTVCRYGGEEFVVVLPGTNAEGAKVVGHKISRSIDELVIPFQESDTEYLTVSIGIASLSMLNGTKTTLFELADSHLKHIKSRKRQHAA